MMTSKSQDRQRAIFLWVMVLSVIAAIGVLLLIAKDRPNFDPGPAILGFLGVMGLLIRAIFKPSEDDQDDGYGR